MKKDRLKQKFGPKFKTDDVVDLFSHLAKINASGLQAFIDEEKKYPCCPGSFIEDYNNDTNAAHDAWIDTLNKMYYSFYECAHEFPNKPSNLKWDAYWKKHDNVALFKVTDDGTLKENDDPEKPKILDHEDDEYNQKIEDGLHLFAKYFTALWL